MAAESSAELERVAEAEQEANGVLQEIQALGENARQVQVDFEAGRSTVATRSAALRSAKEVKEDARLLAKRAAHAARDLQRAAHAAEVALRRSFGDEGAAEDAYDRAQSLSDRIQESADGMRDTAEHVYESLMEQDRMALIEEDRATTSAARNRLQASLVPLTDRHQPRGLIAELQHSASRRDTKGQAAKEEVLVASKKKPAFRTLSSAKSMSPALGTVPVGVRMNGQPTMPTGWKIPGDATVPWMWTEMTIAGTKDTMLLPVRRAVVSELQEALGAMMGRSHEDFQFLVRQGCCTRKLLASDMVPSKLYVKGIKSWERERQGYNHPFAIIGAGHCGLRQAWECLKQGLDDFVVFERLEKVGGAAWLRLANASSRLQTEFGTYHLPFDDDGPIPKGMPTWPSRDEMLQHFQDFAAELGILPHVQLSTRVTGVKVEKLSRLQMLEQGKGDSDPNSQHYKLALQQESPDRNKSDGGKAAPKAKDAKGDEVVPEEGEGAEPAGEGGASVKAAFLASAVMAFPGSLCVPREERYKGEEAFGGPVGYGMRGEFDFEEVREKQVAICGMGSLAVECVRTCLEHSAKKCYIVCRRKNLCLPRAVSWLINQSTYPPAAAEVLRAMLPMYQVASDDPWTYHAVSPDAALIQQKTRFPISDFVFLAQYYGRAEVVVGVVKRLLLEVVMLEDSRRLEVNCVVKALGFTGAFEVDSIMHSSRMFGFWPDADFRRWIFCESVGVDFLNIASTSLSPVVLRVAEYPLHFLNYPKPDYKNLVDAGDMHWQSPDTENDQPAYVLNARDATYVISVVMIAVPALRERDYEGIKQRRQLKCHPLEKFVDAAAADWRRYCDMLSEGADGVEPPVYPYTPAFLEELTNTTEREGKKRVADGGTSLALVTAEDTRTPSWNPYMRMYY